MALFLATSSARAAGDWNDTGVAWRDYETGLREARASNTPVCLVFFTTWCPHCTNYARVFHDAEVVAAAKRFVMIRLDKDQHPELSRKYAVDGEYIPRTYFLSPRGELDPAIHARRDRFQFFYREGDPGSLLGGMTAAQQKWPAQPRAR